MFLYIVFVNCDVDIIIIVLYTCLITTNITTIITGSSAARRRLEQRSKKRLSKCKLSLVSRQCKSSSFKPSQCFKPFELAYSAEKPGILRAQLENLLNERMKPVQLLKAADAGWLRWWCRQPIIRLVATSSFTHCSSRCAVLQLMVHFARCTGASLLGHRRRNHTAILYSRYTHARARSLGNSRVRTTYVSCRFPPAAVALVLLFSAGREEEQPTLYFRTATTTAACLCICISIIILLLEFNREAGTRLYFSKAQLRFFN